MRTLREKLVAGAVIDTASARNRTRHVAVDLACLGSTSSVIARRPIERAAVAVVFHRC
jgi:hypothetical protein